MQIISGERVLVSISIAVLRACSALLRDIAAPVVMFDRTLLMYGPSAISLKNVL